jgi:hypothetical protein
MTRCFHYFVKYLNDEGQQHVAQKLWPERYDLENESVVKRSQSVVESSVNEMITKLEEILEPDYGLPHKMRREVL